MPNISKDIWNDDNALRQAFSWLTRIGAAPKYGSLPIVYYQQDQCKALDTLEMLARQASGSMELDLRTVRLKNGMFRAKYVRFSDTAPRYWKPFARLVCGRILPLA